MVMNEGTMVFRTPRSGKKRGKGILSPLERIIMAPMVMLIMRGMDKDGDGRISFDEMMEEMAGDSKEEIMEMQELFEKHDKDGDGYLTPNELEGLIRESGDETWAEKEANWWSKEDN
jgi:Ca2+-binding EF-hand superfamily protein